MGILLPLLLIFFTCLLIWRACDGFEVASEYIGRNMSEGVRGGTINAISSSLPELFTTLIALFVLANEDGFSVGIGTTAGSALFNGMIIPAICILSVIGMVVAGKKVTSVNVGRKVLLRDGLSLIFCELILILIISGTSLDWWQGAILMGLYFLYFFYMIFSMKKKAATADNGEDEDDDDDDDDESKGPIGTFFYWLSLGPLLDLEDMFIGEKQAQQIKDETWNGWPLLLASAFVIGFACYFLVIACEWLGSGPAHPAHLFGMTLPAGLNMPTMFVAVIFASMATSVPDTVISFRDARDGDYDDAVANALGSNIFDICFALGFPLFLYTILNGPITMSQEIVDQSAELRFLLLVLTVLGFFVYYLGKRDRAADGTVTVRMGRPKGFMLLAIYFSFVAYIIAREMEAGWALKISEMLQKLVSHFPVIG